MNLILSAFSANIAYASLNDFITKVDDMIINPLINLLFALAILFFLYGVFEFIANQENEEKRTTGKSHMIWGLVGLAIMMGVLAILNMILSTFSIDQIKIDKNNGETTIDKSSLK